MRANGLKLRSAQPLYSDFEEGYLVGGGRRGIGRSMVLGATDLGLLHRPNHAAVILDVPRGKLTADPDHDAAPQHKVFPLPMN